VVWRAYSIAEATPLARAGARVEALGLLMRDGWMGLKTH
jgi:hypothetical protein